MLATRKLDSKNDQIKKIAEFAWRVLSLSSSCVSAEQTRDKFEVKTSVLHAQNVVGPRMHSCAAFPSSTRDPHSVLNLQCLKFWPLSSVFNRKVHVDCKATVPVSNLVSCTFYATSRWTLADPEGIPERAH